MISYDAYNLLKAAVEKHIFSEYEEMVASRLCRKYERYEQARAAKKEAYAQEMKSLMLGVLEKADKPLCPTEMQFILYRETGKEYSCGTIACYCGRLCWDDKKLTREEKKNRVYYAIKKD